MKGDFSRLTFDPAKQFSRVLMQQGRVQLDADWNEQSSLLLHHLRALARALVGDYGGEKGAFKVGVKDNNVTIGHGAYFVEGIMCSNDEENPLAFTPPKDWTDSETRTTTPKQGDYLVYLAVAERHITFVNDEDIRERALGDGVDTASRTKIVCVVSAEKEARLRSDDGVVSTGVVDEVLGRLRPDAPRPTMLAAAAEVGTRPHDICTVPPFAEYRGASNQLYRVEIHRPEGGGGDNKNPTFKWSRENGSVVFPLKEPANGKTLVVERYGRDGRFTLRKGDWVEFEDDDIVASGTAGALARVESVDGDRVTLNAEPPKGFAPDDDKDKEKFKAKHPLLRRWDSAPYTVGSGVVEIDLKDETKKYTLENGIEVEFKAKDVGGKYLRGDYWVIPARTAGRKIDWPKDKFLPARRAEGGVAPLAVITVSANSQISTTDDDDLRSEIEPVAKPVNP